MDERELLARIERRLERGDELMALNIEALDRNTAEIRGLRHFAQDLLARFQNLADDVTETLRSQAGAMREQGAAMREQGAAAAMRELGAEAKAHEQALLFILDELRGLRGADGAA